MKAQFKHALYAGGFTRLAIFMVIFVMNFVFILLGAVGLLPLAAQITAVSLSGVGISVMAVTNLIGDISIIRYRFASPRAYLYALTPVPRWKTLLASIVTIVVTDVVTMAASIFGVVMLALNLAGNYVGDLFWNIISINPYKIMAGFWFCALAVAGYLLMLMVIIFCITLNKSLFYQKRGGGMLTALVAIGMLFAINISQIVLAPFGAVSRWGMHFTIYLGRFGIAMYALLLLAEAAALFVITSKLMERKLNI